MTRSRAELLEWYAGRLRPKIADAVSAGAIAPLRAAELDRQMVDLLRRAPDTHERRSPFEALVV